MNKQWIITLILVLAVGAGAFYGGMQYQKSQRATFSRFGNFQGRLGQNGANRVIGKILSTDANSMTVKMSDGSSKIVILSASTVINKAATGTKDDLKTGETVAVFGTTNSDGSVTAQNVQLNPQLRGFMRPTGAPQQ